MFLTQRDFASAMETVEINVPILRDFDLSGYLHCFYSILFKLFIFELFHDKILKIIFRVHKIQEIPAENG